MKHFESGVASLDQEHAYLTLLASRLESEESGFWHRERCRGVLAELQQFTRLHFLTEEQLMEACAYPDSKAHIAEHERMAFWVDAFAAQAKTGTLALPMLRGFVRGWIAAHMATRDRQLAAYLASAQVPFPV
jgi:hemerythrin